MLVVYVCRNISPPPPLYSERNGIDVINITQHHMSRVCICCLHEPVSLPVDMLHTIDVTHRINIIPRDTKYHPIFIIFYVDHRVSKRNIFEKKAGEAIHHIVTHTHTSNRSSILSRSSRFFKAERFLICTTHSLI